MSTVDLCAIAGVVMFARVMSPSAAAGMGWVFLCIVVYLRHFA